MEEGSEAAIPGATLGLVVGHPVQFRFLSATHRKDDIIGTIIDEYTWPDELSEGAPLEARLEAEGKPAGTLVPVRLAIRVTEVGVLEVWCVEQDGPGRWRLEFSVRDDG